MTKTKAQKAKAKNIQKQNSKGGQRMLLTSPQRARSVMVQRMPGLDAMGYAYAQLLASARSGPLVAPTYDGAVGGTIERVSKEVYVGGLADMTGCVLAWVPGNVGQSIWSKVDTVGKSGEYIAGGGPDMTAVVYSSAGARCISASMEVSWGSSELSRSGYVAVTQTVGGMVRSLIAAGSKVAAVDLGTVANYDMRIPDGSVDFHWRPTDSDSEYLEAANAQKAESASFASKGAMVMSLAAMAPNSSVRVKLIAVYQVLPGFLNGTMSSSQNTSYSRNTLRDVIHTMDRQDWGMTVVGKGNTGCIGGMSRSKM